MIRHPCGIQSRILGAGDEPEEFLVFRKESFVKEILRAESGIGIFNGEPNVSSG